MEIVRDFYRGRRGAYGCRDQNSCAVSDRTDNTNPGWTRDIRSNGYSPAKAGDSVLYADPCSGRSVLHSNTPLHLHPYHSGYPRPNLHAQPGAAYQYESPHRDGNSIIQLQPVVLGDIAGDHAGHAGIVEQQAQVRAQAVAPG